MDYPIYLAFFKGVRKHQLHDASRPYPKSPRWRRRPSGNSHCGAGVTGTDLEPTIGADTLAEDHSNTDAVHDIEDYSATYDHDAPFNSHDGATFNLYDDVASSRGEHTSYAVTGPTE